MKIKDLNNIESVLLFMEDFFISNTDADETGLREEIMDNYEKALGDVRAERLRIHKNNILAKHRRNQLPKQETK